VRRSTSASLTLVCAVALAQGPATRLTYGVRVLFRNGADTSVVGTGEVTGPMETGLRLGVHTDSADVDMLLTTFPEPDSFTLAGDFVATRLMGPSRRGLPMYEQDEYRRQRHLAWTDTVRLHPFGSPRARGRRELWIELRVTTAAAGGITRPSEWLELADSSIDLTLEAVVRPRRATVLLALVRGEAGSIPLRLDLVPDGIPRTLDLVVDPAAPHHFEMRLTAPEPARTARARALALDADVVCLRLSEPGATTAAHVLCGRLNNVARRLPLAGGDTLVATFVWPAVR
jgi:hypothetical protein